MARKNLKSMNMNMKANAAAVLGNNRSNLFGSKPSQSNFVGGMGNMGFPGNQFIKEP